MLRRCEISQEEKDMMQELRDHEVPVELIARVFGVSITSVSKYTSSREVEQLEEDRYNAVEILEDSGYCDRKRACVLLNIPYYKVSKMIGKLIDKREDEVYHLISPDRKEVIVKGATGLRDFCFKHHLNPQSFKLMILGKRKTIYGWSCRNVTK
jgi:hypothetical protein